MTQKDWTEQLNERLADYQADVPEGLWADIEQQLPQQNAVVVPLWRRWAGVAAMVALIAGTGWWLWPQSGETTRVAGTAKVVRVTHTAPIAKVVEITDVVAQSEAIAQNVTDSAESRQSQVTQQPHETQQSQETAQPRQTLHPNDSRQSFETHHTMVAKTGQRQGRVNIGVHANSGLLAYSHSNGVQMSPQMMNRYDFSSELPTRGASDDSDPVWLAGYEERQHHDQPIALGLSVGYQLSKRWTLTTGLVYTRLNSQFVNVMQGMEISSDQRLDYLGIPLSVQCQVLGGQRWRLYAALGAQADWNVRASMDREGVGVDIGRDKLQWSLGGAVGIQYDIIPMLGIYAEPGFRYYFDNHSPLINFFKDHPASWNLQLGIRVNLTK